MKRAFRIARLELSSLFYSPIAWLVLVIFIFQSGLSFADIFDMLSKAIKFGVKQDGYTNLIFAHPTFGLFPAVVKNIYLYIPLLTMGLMSREFQSGSIKLLYSSPIRIRDIILGKFIAMCLYGLSLILILVCFVIAGSISIIHPDIAQLVSGLFGIYLLICTYSAIGLFMSCLTSYQVVAAISTLVVFAALNFVGQIGQNIGFVRDITYFLSIAGRTSEFISGLIRTNDVFYFMVIIGIFLGLSYLKLLQARESKPALIKALQYISVVAGMIFVGYITSLPALTGYLDMTENNRRTLTDSSRAVITQMNKPLTITGYVNILDDNASVGLPKQWNSNKNIFEKYTRFKPDLKLKYVYYYDSSKSDYLYTYNPGLTLEQIARKNADIYDVKFESLLTPQQIRKQVDLSGEERRFVWMAEYDGRRSFIRNFHDQQTVPDENEITSGLKQLTGKPWKVLFLTGHRERDISQSGDKDYKIAFHDLTFRFSLINHGLLYDTINLIHNEIPSEAAALVIADPQIAFTAEEISRIKSYIGKGGNLLIAGKPDEQPILNPILQCIGAKYGDGKAEQHVDGFPPDFIVAEFNKPSSADAASYDVFYNKSENKKVSFPGSIPVEYADTGSFHHFPVMIAQGMKGPIVSALGITRKWHDRQQRIMVLGSADLMANVEIMRQNLKVENLLFTHEIFRWLSYGEYPPDTQPADSKDNDLKAYPQQVLWLRIVFLGILPALLVITGAVLLIKRRRR